MPRIFAFCDTTGSGFPKGPSVP